MRNLLIASTLAILTACSPGGSEPSGDESTAAKPKRPNILLIVADDLGYSDISPFGGEIATPVLDRLAAEGTRFSGFHVLPTCSPTRAALLSGNDNHVAGLGVMGEFIYPAVADLPGYAGHLADQVVSIPEILRDAGYHSYMTGKWHLGEDDDQSPYARGFEQTFTMMNGGGSHWADQRPLSPPQTMIYRRNGERVDVLPDDFYSTKNYTDAMIEFIDANKYDGKPFFAYLSYTAPHDPLHAPADFIERHSGKYDEGWEALARQRLASLKVLGIVPETVDELPPNFLTRKWGMLTDDEKQLFARDMEVYAAMVEYMDMSIGRVFDYLKSAGLYENTLILFFSDNGANGANPRAYPGNADGRYLATFDNSLDNRGLPGSFIDMGASWAQASSAPFRLFKSFTTQGGIRSPMIARLPGGTESAREWNHAFLHVTDVLPTILDVAGANYPATRRGKALKQPIGNSIVPVLQGRQASIDHSAGTGYELFEMKAFIRDEWKLLRLPEPFGTGEWQLYNLEEDPGEIHDVSADHPDVAVELTEAWQEYARQNELFDHAGHFDALYRQAFSRE